MPTPPVYKLPSALPFWVSVALLPVIGIAAIFGGWAILLIPLSTWWAFSILDVAIGNTDDNADPETPEAALAWHKAVTLVWPALQTLMIFGTIAYAARADHLALWETLALAAGVGVLTGAIGINYAHELMHQRNRVERWLADILLAEVLYSHFRSEHLLVHHRHVATPADAVTARLGQNFHRSFLKTLWRCLNSAWHAETALLARKNLSTLHRRNPFWRYALLQIACLTLAAILGGTLGVIMFLIQAVVAVWQLELVNFVEHYGLTRRHLGGGKYEPVRPHHSWNATQTASNWLLINLQRHSDHHYKPDRRFPTLQTYDAETAPQLPYGYPVMTLIALVPPLWRRVMDPRVIAWRNRHYPDIQDWEPYTKGLNPGPIARSLQNP